MLKTADNKFYAGTSNDYQKRFETHKSFKGAKFTRVASRHPLKLIFVEEFSNKGDALSFEIRFKKFTRQQKEDYLKSHKNLLEA